MPGGEHSTTPSESFMREGQPTQPESRTIEIIARRRDYLKHELDVEGGYPGRGHDVREFDALCWVLELVATIRREGGLNGGSSEVPDAD